jgi:DNA-binding MarR family transcriptional regulator
MLSEADVSGHLKSLGHAVKLFKELKQIPLPTSAVAMLCAVATDEGNSVAKYGRAVDANFNNASRSIADLSDVDRYGGHGLGLVQKRPGRDEREVLCFLTAKGRAFAHRISSAIAPKVMEAA